MMGLAKLEMFLKKHAFWASNRKKNDLKQMLANSPVVVSLWKKRQLIGFGRATSDTIYRAVLWDVVVADELQGIGLGKIVVNALLETPSLKKVERVYLMTTNSQDFYEQLGFKKFKAQSLMIKSINQVSNL
tara:strand:- start:130 stop:522 length:393 start_codon:yes stop_codon:yes gene_type:complete